MQKGQRNKKTAELKLAEQKIWWGPMAEQKMLGPLSHWVAGGTPSASAKRSVEQKCGIKIGGIKLAELKLAELKLAE